MKALVTGSTGLLGANVVRQLLSNNYQVKVIIRETSNAGLLEELDLELMYGNITSAEDVADGALSCDAIIHIAADTYQHYTKLNEYQEVNVESVKHVIEAARIHNIKKVIYVSSAAVFGYGTKERPGSETEESKPPFCDSLYLRSKAAGQELILAAAAKTETDFIIVNPSFMLGAYDSKPSSGKIVMMSYNKHVVFVPPGGKNFIHVRDVAKGICNALEEGENGECYLLTNENLTYAEFFKIIGKSSGHKSLYLHIPASLLKFAGLLFSLLAKIGIKSSFNAINAKILCAGNYYSNSKAVKTLALPATPISEAVEDAVSWFKQAGVLKTS